MKEALKGDDAAAIKSASERLNEAWQAVSAELYRAASEKTGRGGPQPGGEQPGAQRGKPGEDEVVDAEIIDEEKKRAA